MSEVSPALGSIPTVLVAFFAFAFAIAIAFLSLIFSRLSFNFACLDICIPHKYSTETECIGRFDAPSFVP